MTSTIGPTDLDEVIDRIDRIYAEALTVDAEPERPAQWHHLRDRALGELTAGLPDVDCGVCIAASPPIAAADDDAAAVVTRGLMLSWLAGSREQLRLGRAVARSLSRSHRPADRP